MTGTTYERKSKRAGDYPCTYRVNNELRIVQYSTNNGISWHKSCITIPQFQQLINTQHMVEVALI